MTRWATTPSGVAISGFVRDRPLSTRSGTTRPVTSPATAAAPKAKHQ